MQVYRNPLGILESWKGGHTRSLRCLCTSRASAWWGGSSSSLDFFNMDIPGAQMTSIFEGQPPKTRPFPIKTRVIWVPGIYIYIHILIWWHILYIQGCQISSPRFVFGDFFGGIKFHTLERFRYTRGYWKQGPGNYGHLGKISGVYPLATRSRYTLVFQKTKTTYAMRDFMC